MKRNRRGQFIAYKRWVIEKLKDLIVYVVIGALLALTAFQYQTVQLLEQLIDSAEQVEQSTYQPAIDPCTLHVVDCAEAAVVDTKEVEAELLADYLRSKGGHEMAEHARDIVELYRWQDVVAIAWKETQFCTTGVGASRNNCGGIKSWRTDRTFKVYDNVYDSLWDISYLLNKPRYKGLTIAEMNGTYCVNEAAGGGKCPNWSEVINSIKSELALATTAK